MTSCEIPPKYEGPIEMDGGKSESPSTNSEDDGPCVKEGRLTYSKECLLQLRSAPASLERPADLLEPFFNSNGLWDPARWHASPSSRGSSPVFNAKPLAKEEKKAESMEDSVDLTPQRRSFRLGCQVQPSTEATKPERVLPVVVQNKKNLEFASGDGKKRLTGRAAGQRKLLERVHMKDKDYVPDNDNRKSEKPSRKATTNGQGRDGRRNREESLPEWVTGGPTSQSDTIELKGFDEGTDKRTNGKKKAKEGKNDGTAVKPTPSNDSNNGTPKTLTLQEEAEILHQITSRGSTPSGDAFDLNAFLSDGGEYLPSDLFIDGETDASMKSKFSQWFQLSQSSSGGSRPNSETFGDQGWTGASSSPPVPSSYFMPIQPASTVAPDKPQSLLDILQKGRDGTEKKPIAVKEIKGRMNADEIEARVMGKPKDTMQTLSGAPSATPQENTAFTKLVAAMKQAGQLPEKPAPVVVGLPEHLLPKPPQKTSPSFEKLKRALSRSPSPVHMQFDSPAAASLFNNHGSASVPQQQPGFYLPQEQLNNSFMGYANPSQQVFNSPMTPSYNTPHANHAMHTPSSQPLATPGTQKYSTDTKKPYVPAAFMPTSVIRKIHKDMHEQKSEAKVKLFSTEQGATPENTPAKSAAHLAPGGPVAGKTTMSATAVSSAPSTPERRSDDKITSGHYVAHSAPVTPMRSGDDVQDMRRLFQQLSSGEVKPLPVTQDNNHSQQEKRQPSAASPLSGQSHVDNNATSSGISLAPGGQREASSFKGMPTPNQLSEAHHAQAMLRQNLAAKQGHQIMQLLQQSKDHQDALSSQGKQFSPGLIRPEFPPHHPQHPGQGLQRQATPSPNPFQPAAFAGVGNYQQQQQQALQHQLGMNRMAHATPGITPDMLAQQAVGQQQLLQQKLIQAAHALQQQQQHQQQMERQLAIQRSMAMNRQRLPFNQTPMPYNQRQFANNMHSLAQRMNMRGSPNSMPQHRPLPTPMLNQQQTLQQHIAMQQRHQQQHHELPVRQTAPSMPPPPGNAIPPAKGNAFSMLFGSESLKLAGACSNAIPTAKALTVEELESLPK